MRIPNFQERAWPLLKRRKKATKVDQRHTMPNRVKTKSSFDNAKLTRLYH